MKKLAAIWILAIMLFNGMGYELLTMILQQHADASLQANIDAGNFHQEDLIELSVPLDLAYINNWTDWEHFEGDLEIDGIHYRYVERKVEDGRLHVKCLPNQERQNISSAREEFFKLTYDMGQQSQNKKTNAVYISNYIGDYDNIIENWSLKMPETAKLALHAYQQNEHPDPFIDVPIIPPEFVA